MQSHREYDDQGYGFPARGAGRRGHEYHTEAVDNNYGFKSSHEKDDYDIAYNKGGVIGKSNARDSEKVNWTSKDAKTVENADVNWLMSQRQLDPNDVNWVNKVLEKWTREYDETVHAKRSEYLDDAPVEILGLKTECLKFNLKQIIIEILNDLGVGRDAVIALINQKILEFSLTLEAKFTNKIKLINYDFYDLVETVDTMYVIKKYGVKWVVKRVVGVDVFEITYSCSDLHPNIPVDGVSSVVDTLEYAQLNELNI